MFAVQETDRQAFAEKLSALQAEWRQQTRFLETRIAENKERMEVMRKGAQEREAVAEKLRREGEDGAMRLKEVVEERNRLRANRE